MYCRLKHQHKAPDTAIRAFYLGLLVPTVLHRASSANRLRIQAHHTAHCGAFDVVLTPPTIITGIPMLDVAIEGNVPYFLSSLKHVILPSMALALVTFGVLTRVLRSSLLDVMHSNYIRTARAKGADENTVFYKHALRNAMISVVTISSLMVTFIITGTIFVENVFAYPGMGQYLVTALSAQDYPGRTWSHNGIRCYYCIHESDC